MFLHFSSLFFTFLHFSSLFFTFLHFSIFGKNWKNFENIFLVLVISLDLGFLWILFGLQFELFSWKSIGIGTKEP